MRAAYLDFYSKSLQDPNSPDYLPFSSKLRIEQKYHDLIVSKMMDKEIFPENIERNPLLSKENDLKDSKGVRDSTIYTMKAGQTFVERSAELPGDKKKASALDLIKSGYSSQTDKSGAEYTADSAKQP